MSEIASLTSRAQQLGISVDWWTTATVWLTCTTAILGFLSFGALYFRTARTKALGEIKDAIIAAKDRGLSQDLKAKDEEIGKAKKEAAEANERAGLANEAAGKANQSAQGLTVEAARMREQTLETESKLERERIERLKLEAQIAPRRLTPEQQQQITQLCSRFRGRRVIVVSYSLDIEGAVLSKQIVAALQGSGMTVVDSTTGMMAIGGILIGIHVNGAEHDLVNSLSTILATAGRLSVARPNSDPPTSPGAYSNGRPEEPQPVSILVGVKPMQ